MKRSHTTSHTATSPASASHTTASQPTAGGQLARGDQAMPGTGASRIGEYRHGGTPAVSEVTLNYGGADIVKGLTLELPPGKISVIVGANGCGKSTLLRGLSRLLKPAGGVVTLDGEDIHRMAPKALARRVALLPQSPITPEALTVRELVAHGRAPYRSALRREDAQDRAAIERALAATHLQDLAERVVADLSGGQRQRAWIAMALAQETDVLLLDEPTTFLDLAHQVDVLQTVRELNVRRGTTVVMVLHDLNLAARYAHHLVALRGGELVAQGTPDQVVTVPIVREVFGLDTMVVPDPATGTPLVVPLAGAIPNAIPNPVALSVPIPPGEAS